MLQVPPRPLSNLGYREEQTPVDHPHGFFVMNDATFALIDSDQPACALPAGLRLARRSHQDPNKDDRTGALL